MTSTTPTEQELKRAKDIVDKAKNDYYFFCKKILGFDKMRRVPHRDLCDHVASDTGKKKLILMPRGSFKSTVVTCGYTLFSLVKDPNARVLITSETQRNAIRYVKEVQAHIEGNERFRAIFGDLVNKKNTWKENEFIINTRTKVQKDPSVLAGSLEKGMLTGAHFNVIIIDDPVSLNNTANMEQIAKTLEFYRMLHSILDPDGQLIVIGTRYSVFDLYGHIIENEADQFSIFMRKAIDQNGNLLMPDVLSNTFLERQKKTQGTFVFSCQYMNEPINEDSQVFKHEHVQYYDKVPPGCNYFMSLDPAIATGKLKTDFTAILVAAVDHEENWYLEEAVQLKMDPMAVVEEIFALAKKYSPIMCLGMEKYVLEKFFEVILNKEFEERKFWIPIKQLSTNNRISKFHRIKALQPRFEQKKIFLKKDQIQLAHQIVYYPQVRNDDLLDALKNFLQITWPADPPKYRPEKKYEHLSPSEQQIWKDLDKMGTRRVRRKKWKRL